MSTPLQLLPSSGLALGPVSMRSRLERFTYAASNQLSIYLPPILMALLALLTYWMVRLTPPVLPPEVQRPLRHSADYFMRDFAVKSYDAQGLLKSEIKGSMANHFEDTDVLEITQPRIRSFDAAGRLVTASADRALSNGDGSEVQLIGNAVVLREAMAGEAGHMLPRVEYRGEFLHVLQNMQRLRSHKPVRITSGADQFSADQLEFDNLGQVAELTGHVRASMAPRK